MSKKPSTQEHINKVIEFRQAIHANGFGKPRDALIEALEALCMTGSLLSFPLLSLCKVFRRQWHSLYKAVERGTVKDKWFSCHLARQVPQSGSTGGYGTKKLEENKYQVWFYYNQFTDLETIRNYLNYRCAEITLENGKDYFIVESEDQTKFPLKLEYVIKTSNTKPGEYHIGFDAKQVKKELMSWIAGHK